MAQRRAQGSTLGFVLVGVLLTALLIGGIYFVRHNLARNKAPTTTEGVVAGPDQSDDTKNDTTTNKDKTTADPDQKLKDALAAQSAEEKKAQQQREAQSKESTQTTPAQSTPQQTNPTPQASQSQPTSQVQASLPTTGPEDVVVPVMGAALLAGIGMSYIRSRRLI